MKIKEIRVNLRSRKIDERQEELFIDYRTNGKRVRKSLGLFILSGRLSRIEKKRNDETRHIAETQCRQLEEILNGRQDTPKSIRFYDFYDRCANSHEGKTRESWQSALVHIRIYEPDNDILLSDITREWIEGFRSYLEEGSSTTYTRRGTERRHHGLAQNTAANYFAKVVACFNAAAGQGLITVNPCNGIRRIPVKESERSFLTAAELGRLIKTRCADSNVKRAFVFACMTGLRYSDVQRLRWSSIQEADGYMRIVYRQKKTGEQQYPPLNDVAVEQLGKRKEPETNVFKLGTNKTTNDILQKWCLAAGLRKHVTFHCSRHTFATLLLESGTDIYTASKLLGHRKVQTTQIYAKVVDRRQREAVERLNDLF